MKLVELAGTRQNPNSVVTPLSLCRDSVTDGNIANVEAVGAAIERALRKLGFAHKGAAAALPTSMVITNALRCQRPRAEDDLEQAVKARRISTFLSRLTKLTSTTRLSARLPTTTPG